MKFMMERIVLYLKAFFQQQGQMLDSAGSIFHFIYSFQPLRPFKAHFWHA
jgi:hypothetical protein